MTVGNHKKVDELPYFDKTSCFRHRQLTRDEALYTKLQKSPDRPGINSSTLDDTSLINNVRVTRVFGCQGVPEFAFAIGTTAFVRRYAHAL